MVIFYVATNREFVKPVKANLKMEINIDVKFSKDSICDIPIFVLIVQ